MPTACLFFYHLLLVTPRQSISGMPNNAGPLPGTTKNLHTFCFSLCINVKLQVPSHLIVSLLDDFILVFLLSACDNSFFVDQGNRIFYIQDGKILLLLPVSILYKMFGLLW